MAQNNRLFVLALDGVPFSFLNDMFSNGLMPNLAQIAQKGDFKTMNSIIPPVSSSAWASFLTGTTPDKHGILSFTERDAATMNWFTPDARHLRGKTILEILSNAGKKVFSMNVPVTYPPQVVNGISICGFLGTDIEKGTYPAKEGPFLKQNGYRIDVDTELAKRNMADFLKDLDIVLEKRIEMMWYYFEKEQWDFFMTHIMETDRLFHFTWEYMESKDPVFVKIYERFFTRLDNLIGDIETRVNGNMQLMFLSDHGFTTLKQEVYLNRWLWENDYLKFIKPYPADLNDIHPLTKAYALYPGRIFVNLKGREKTGSVNAGIEYEKIKANIKNKLSGLTFPANKEKVISSVLDIEDVYNRDNISKDKFADMYVFAEQGYEIKGQLWNTSLFSKTFYNGMHTQENAFILTNEFKIPVKNCSITDVARMIFSICKVE